MDGIDFALMRCYHYYSSYMLHGLFIVVVGN